MVVMEIRFSLLPCSKNLVMFTFSVTVSGFFFALQKWVWAFRDETFNNAVKTNNSVERQNRVLKHDYLKNYSDTSFSGLITVLVEQYLPDKYSR